MKFEDLLKEHLSNEEVKQEYDALEPEFQIARSALEAQKIKNMTQKQLSDRLSCRFRIEFVPK